jgi:hypothetical protein
MAVNKPVGDNARKGAVKKPTQLATRTMGKKIWTKRDKTRVYELKMPEKRPRPRRSSRASGASGKLLGRGRRLLRYRGSRRANTSITAAVATSNTIPATDSYCDNFRRPHADLDFRRDIVRIKLVLFCRNAEFSGLHRSAILTPAYVLFVVVQRCIWAKPGRNKRGLLRQIAEWRSRPLGPS